MDSIIGLLIKLFVISSIIRSFQNAFKEEMKQKKSAETLRQRDFKRPIIKDIRIPQRHIKDHREPLKKVETAPAPSAFLSDVEDPFEESKIQRDDFLEDWDEVDDWNMEEDLALVSKKDDHEALELDKEALLRGIVLAEILGPPLCKRRGGIPRWNL